jgi:hypothetical protein
MLVLVENLHCHQAIRPLLLVVLLLLLLLLLLLRS